MGADTPQPCGARRWTLLALAAAVLTAAVAVARWPSGYVAFDSIGRPDTAVLIASVLVLAAARLPTRTRGGAVFGRLVAAAAALTVAAITLSLVLLIVTVGKPEVLPAPDKTIFVETEPRSAAIDPVWYLWLTKDDGLLSRRYRLGCLNGDDPASSLADLRWIDHDTVQVTTASGLALSTDIDARSGRPQDHLNTGVCP